MFHVVEAVPRRILCLLLLLSFVVDALLVSTLLIWARRVWGGAMCFSKSDPIESSIQDFYKIFIFAIGRPFKRQLTLIVISMPGAYVCIQSIVCIVIVKKKKIV